MFYYYFRFFNYICAIFGQSKPFPSQNLKNFKLRFLHQFWSFTILVAILVSSIETIDFSISLHIKKNDETENINEFIVSLVIFLTNLRRENVYVELYNLINTILSGLQIDGRVIKMFAVKLYLWIFLLTFLYCVAIIKEILLLDPPFEMVLRIPLYLTLWHLFIHLSIIRAILRVINLYLFGFFKLSPESEFLFDFSEEENVSKYLVSFDIAFMKIPRNKNINLKYLCKVYDNLSSSVQMLQKLHSFQIIMTIWLMFSSAVSSVALISTEKTDNPWLNVVNGILPFVWYSVGCFISDQMRQEVERTNLIIVKLLIDFRCDDATKEILDVFKQAISVNSLQFTAGNMYRLNYSTMLGTLVSVITYSIIVIQLF